MSVRLLVVTSDMAFFDDVVEIRDEVNTTAGEAFYCAPEFVHYLDNLAARAAADEPGEPVVVIVSENARLNRKERGQPTIERNLREVEPIFREHGHMVVVGFQTGNVTPATNELRERLGHLVAVNDPAEANHFEQLAAVLLRIRSQLAAGADAPALQPDGIIEFRFCGPQASFQTLYASSDADEGLRSPESPILMTGNDPIGRFVAMSRSLDDCLALREDLALDDDGDLAQHVSALQDAGIELVSTADVIRQYNYLLDRWDKKKLRNVRIRIRTSPEAYPGLFETLHLRGNGEPMFVRHPAYRSIELSRVRCPRLEWSDRKPVNVLAVLANDYAEGVVTALHPDDERKDERLNLSRLEYGEDETALFAAIREAAESGELLLGNKKRPLAVKLGNVTLVQTTPDKGIVDILRELLAKDRPDPVRYDIFHFAGHAYQKVSEAGSEVRLLLPRPEKDYVDWIDLTELSLLLENAHVQFAYLNCCGAIPGDGGVPMSRVPSAVPQIMAQRMIPVTLGYRWSIMDKRAFEFAKAFYIKLLCRGLSFDQCVQEARREIYKPSDLSYAAPVLLLQHVGEDAIPPL